MMRVLVCGSRGWHKNDAIFYRLHKFDDFVLVHGGAIGADQMAAAIAVQLGATIELYLPDWKAHGRTAGLKRNVQMLDTKPDLVIAFWDGTSTGTKHTITEALKRRINTEVIFG